MDEDRLPDFSNPSASVRARWTAPHRLLPGGLLPEWLPPVARKMVTQNIRSGRLRNGLLFFAVAQVAAAAYWSVKFPNSPHWLSPEFMRLAFYQSVAAFFAVFAYLVIPATAFQSVVEEREGAAFDLLRTTPLVPHGLLAGVVWGAMLLVGCYFAAALPAAVVLHGWQKVSVASGAAASTWILFKSIGLIVLATAAAAVAPGRGGRLAALTVVLGMGLLALWSSTEPVRLLLQGSHIWYEARSHRSYYEDATTDYAMYPLQTFEAVLAASSALWVLYAAAAAALTPRGGDRSRLVRTAVLAFVAALTFCAVLNCISSRASLHTATSANARAWDEWWALVTYGSGLPRLFGFGEALFQNVGPMGRYAYLVAAVALLGGAFSLGEPPRLSRQVRLGLPITLFGRIFLRWLKPGPASGYVFYTGLAVAAALFSTFFPYVAEHLGPRIGRVEAWNWYHRPTNGAACGYVALLLGAGWRLHETLERARPGVYPAWASVLTATLASLAAAAALREGANVGLWYAPGWLVAAFNPFSGASAGLHKISPEDRDFAAVLVSAAGLAMFVACLPRIAAELRQRREFPSLRELREDHRRAQERRKRFAPRPSAVRPQERADDRAFAGVLVLSAVLAVCVAAYLPNLAERLNHWPSPFNAVDLQRP